MHLRACNKGIKTRPLCLRSLCILDPTAAGDFELDPHHGKSLGFSIFPAGRTRSDCFFRLGVHVVGVLILRALLLVVPFRPPDFSNSQMVLRIWTFPLSAFTFVISVGPAGGLFSLHSWYLQGFAFVYLGGSTLWPACMDSFNILSSQA